jgi:hypothetical protein
MPDVVVNKRHLSLPWAAAASVIVGIISGSGVFFTLRGEVAAAQTYAERVEREAVQRFVQAERRIEKLEETGNRTVLLLERIDERTLEMKRQIEESRRGVISRTQP